MGRWWELSVRVSSWFWKGHCLKPSFPNWDPLIASPGPQPLWLPKEWGPEGSSVLILMYFLHTLTQGASLSHQRETKKRLAQGTLDADQPSRALIQHSGPLQLCQSLFSYSLSLLSQGRQPILAAPFLRVSSRKISNITIPRRNRKDLPPPLSGDPLSSALHPSSPHVVHPILSVYRILQAKLLEWVVISSSGDLPWDLINTVKWSKMNLEIKAGSVLAWRIPGTGKPGGLLSLGSHRVGHNWSDLAAAAGHGNFNTHYEET